MAAIAWIVSALVLTSDPLADPPRESRSGLRVVEVVSELPLPYQAVRLRQRICNSGDSPVEAGLGNTFVTIKTPTSDHYEPIAEAVRLLETGSGLAGGFRRPWNESGDVQLAPHETISQTEASASYLQDGKLVPMFREPGEYRISWTGISDHSPYVIVRVRDPQGADCEILRLMQEDALLAKAMISPGVIPDGQTVAQLEAIVREHPDSSYSDYAFFALARGKLRGWGIQAMKEGVFGSLGLTAAWLEGRLAEPRMNRFNLEDGVRNRMKRYVEPLRGQELQLVVELDSARTAGINERSKVAQRWAHFFYVSDADRAAALDYLQRINRPGFAFRAHALVIESRLLRISQMLDEKQAHADTQWIAAKQWDLFYDLEHTCAKKPNDLLNREYGDSLEWVYEMFRSIRTAEEWRAFRVQRRSTAR